MRLTTFITEQQQSIYKGLSKVKTEWTLVDREGVVITSKPLKTYDDAYVEWEKYDKNNAYIVNVKLSDDKALAMVHFPLTQKQKEPNFKYEKIVDIGFTHKWDLAKNLGKGMSKNVY